MRDSRTRNFLSPDLRALLMSNGLEAEIIMDAGGNPVLNVRGDRGAAMSPPLSYKITPKQMTLLSQAMYDGTGSRVKKGYEMINSIIAKDFYSPQSFVIARETGITRNGSRNRLTPVNMGWNGVNIRMGHHPYAPYRRVEGRVDGSLKPGETAAMRQLPNGMYVPTAGYVWRGAGEIVEIETPRQTGINLEIKPKEAPRPEAGKAIPLENLANTAGNDTFVQLNEVLESHGILLKEGKDQNGKAEKQLIIMAKNAKVNITYTLTDEEWNKLTAGSWRKDGSLQERLDIINNVIQRDFNEPVTKEMLQSKDLIDLTYKEGRREILEQKFVAYEQQQLYRQQLASLQEAINFERERIMNDPAAIDGRDITSIINGKAFFEPGNAGRQMVVGEIRVNEIYDTEKKEGKYYEMCAVINGMTEKRNISEKEYNRFLEYNDANRLKMFADKFDVRIDHGRDNSWEIVNGPNGICTAQDLRIAETVNASVNANILSAMGKGTYASIKGGREKTVGDIRVIDIDNPAIAPQMRAQLLEMIGKKADDKNVHHVITANIDGKTVVHEMTEKNYQRFMASNDKERLRIADKIFDEFKIKYKDGHNPFNGRNVLSILGAVAGATVAVVTTKDMIEHGPHRGPFNPERPLMAAQHTAEVFESLVEDVSATVENIGSGLRK